MNTTSSLHRLGLGTLSALVAGTAAAVDTSQWKCESCPADKGFGATVEVGVGVTSDRSPIYGDDTGLDRKGNHGVAGGGLSWRGGNGLYADARAADLGLDSRSLTGNVGREGVFDLRLGYDEIPRHFAEGAATPFLGAGSGSLLLPAGYPAGTTSAMPLAATLRPLDIGYTRKRLDAGATASTASAWSWRVDAHRDVRDGTRVGSGSFFANAAQLPLPVDQSTDRIEVSGHYSGSRLQLSLGWQASSFHDDTASLTWSNPFTPVAAGATTGTLALPPSNRFHQITATLGYDIGPGLRLAADMATGRMTQDAPFVALTDNALLAVGSLPSTSLHGRTKTLDGSVRLSAEPADRVRLQFAWVHNERENDTPVSTWPGVSADVFVANAASNQPYSFKRDRARVQADYRGDAGIKLSTGLEHDRVERTLQEVASTREDRIWARVAAPLGGLFALAVKFMHASRQADNPQAVAAVQPPENALLRRFELAERRRDGASARLDVALAENVALGIDAEGTYDNYTNTALGLRFARTGSIGTDIAVGISDETQLTGYARGEQTRSRQDGSQNFSTPDWTGRIVDRVELFGVGLRHSALKGKLEMGADAVVMRARSRVDVNPGSATPAFPLAYTSRDALTAHLTYEIRPNLWLVTRYAYEHWRAQDWHFEGVTPSAVDNLLAFGTLTPRAHQQLLSVAVRQRF